MKKYIVLKVGGSVLTDKHDATAVINSILLDLIARAVARAGAMSGDTLIVIHGVGTYGHVLAAQYQLHHGVRGDTDKLRAAEQVHAQCSDLNTIIVDKLRSFGLPAVGLSPDQCVVQQSGVVLRHDISVVTKIIDHHKIPVLHGDMVTDVMWDLSVCSGDVLVKWLCAELPVRLVGFATNVDGVYSSNPHTQPKAKKFSELTDVQLQTLSGVSGSAGIDVTGGMMGKLSHCLDGHGRLIADAVCIFNGSVEYNYELFFTNQSVGTKIKRAVF